MNRLLPILCLSLATLGLTRPVFAAQASDPRLNDAKRILALAADAASNMQPSQLRSTALKQIAQEYLRLSDEKAAERAASALPGGIERDAALREVVLARVSRGDESAARRWAEDHPDDGDLMLYSLSVRQAQSGDLAGAKRTAAGITDSLGRDATQVQIALAHGRAGQFDQAMQCAEKIKEKETRALVLLGLAAAQRTRGDLAAAAGLCKSVAKLVASLDRERKPLLMMELAVEVAREGDFPEALRIAGGIRDIEPQRVRAGSTLLYSNGIYGLKERVLCQIALEQARAGRIEDALGTAAGVRDVEAKTVQIGNATMMGKGFYGGRAAVTCRIAQFKIGTGDLAAGAQIIEQIPSVTELDREYRIEALLSLGTAQAMAAKKEAAHATFALALSAVAGKPSETVPLLIRIGRAQGAAGDAEAAVRTFNRALERASTEEDSERARLLVRLASAALERDRALGIRILELAAQAARECSSAGLRNYYLGDVASEWIAVGEVEKALALVSAALADSRPGLLANLAQRQAQKGLFREALPWAEARSNLDEKAFALLGIAQGLVRLLLPEPPRVVDWEWQLQ